MSKPGEIKLKEQVEKLKEGLARYEAEHDELSWEYLLAHADNPKCLSMLCLYRAKATDLLRTVLSPYFIDTGELTEEEMRREYIPDREYATGFRCAKAARAKFVSIGEIVKEGK